MFDMVYVISLKNLRQIVIHSIIMFHHIIKHMKIHIAYTINSDYIYY